MAESYAIRESRVQDILEVIPPGIKPNISSLATQYHISYAQLLNRYNRIGPKQSHSYALKPEEENALYHYLQRLDRMSISYRRPMLLRAVNSILRERPGPVRRVLN